VAIPLFQDEQPLRAVYDHLDGLLISGGADVHPQWYGSEPHPQLGQTDSLKDQTEIRLTQWAVRDGLPLLAICRGLQVANVALGGTLYQDIANQLPGSLVHSDPERPRDYLAHEVSLEPQSRLRRIFGQDRIKVNSLHHQAVWQDAPGLAVTARADDGIIEGMEHGSHPFFVTVQFHPEELYQKDEVMLSLFRAFIEAAQGEHYAR
jgi:putative glutamine amidotransferase